MNSSRPRHSVLNMFDPLNAPVTPRDRADRAARTIAASPDSDKENDVPARWEGAHLTMTAFVERTYGAKKPAPPKQPRVPQLRLVDVGDETMQVTGDLASLCLEDGDDDEENMKGWNAEEEDADAEIDDENLPPSAASSLNSAQRTPFAELAQDDAASAQPCVPSPAWSSVPLQLPTHSPLASVMNFDDGDDEPLPSDHTTGAGCSSDTATALEKETEEERAVKTGHDSELPPMTSSPFICSPLRTPIAEIDANPSLNMLLCSASQVCVTSPQWSSISLSALTSSPLASVMNFDDEGDGDDHDEARTLPMPSPTPTHSAVDFASDSDSDAGADVENDTNSALPAYLQRIDDPTTLILATSQELQASLCLQPSDPNLTPAPLSSPADASTSSADHILICPPTPSTLAHFASQVATPRPGALAPARSPHSDPHRVSMDLQSAFAHTSFALHADASFDLLSSVAFGADGEGASMGMGIGVEDSFDGGEEEDAMIEALAMRELARMRARKQVVQEAANAGNDNVPPEEIAITRKTSVFRHEPVFRAPPQPVATIAAAPDPVPHTPAATRRSRPRASTVPSPEGTVRPAQRHRHRTAPSREHIRPSSTEPETAIKVQLKHQPLKLPPITALRIAKRSARAQSGTESESEVEPPSTSSASSVDRFTDTDDAPRRVAMKLAGTPKAVPRKSVLAGLAHAPLKSRVAPPSSSEIGADHPPIGMGAGAVQPLRTKKAPRPSRATFEPVPVPLAVIAPLKIRKAAPVTRRPSIMGTGTGANTAASALIPTKAEPAARLRPARVEVDRTKRPETERAVSATAGTSGSGPRRVLGGLGAIPPRSVLGRSVSARAPASKLNPPRTSAGVGVGVGTGVVASKAGPPASRLPVGKGMGSGLPRLASASRLPAPSASEGSGKAASAGAAFGRRV